MAYTFDKLGTMLDDQSGEKQNVFGPVTKGTGTSEVGQESAGAPIQQGVPQTQAPAASEKTLMAKNVAYQPTQMYEKAKGELGQAKTGLESEKQNYLQTAGAAYGMTPELATQAIGGNEEAFSNLANLMAGGARQVEGFTPKTQTQSKTLEKLGTETGLGQMFQQAQGPEYSAGERALDVGLLGKSKEFQKQKEALGGQQAQLGALSAQYQKELPTQGQEAAQKQYETETGAVKNLLTGKASELTATQKKEAAEKTAALQKQAQEATKQENILKYARGALPKITSGMSDRDVAILNEIFNNPNLGDAALSKILPQDIAKYYSGPTSANWQQMVNPEEAAQFNRIQSLLGGNQAWTPGIAQQAQGWQDPLATQAIRESFLNLMNQNQMVPAMYTEVRPGVAPIGQEVQESIYNFSPEDAAKFLTIGTRLPDITQLPTGTVRTI